MTALSNTSAGHLVEGEGSLLSNESVLWVLDCSGSMTERIDENDVPTITPECTCGLKPAPSFDCDACVHRDDCEDAYEANCPRHAGKYCECDLSPRPDPKFEHKYITRTKAMKQAITAFLEQRIAATEAGSTDETAVAIFPSDKDYSKVVMPFSYARPDSIQRVANAIHTNGATPLGAALRQVSSLFASAAGGFLTIKVVSDGEPDNITEAIAASNWLFEELGITVDTIGIALRENSRAMETMKAMAEAGHGEFTNMSSAEDMKQKFLSYESERRALLGNGILLLEGPSA